MTSIDRYIALLAAVITCLAAVMGGLLWMVKLLWNIRGQWDATNAQLSRLVDKMSDMSARDNRIEERLERHLAWHDRPRDS